MRHGLARIHVKIVRLFGPNQARSQGGASEYNAPTVSMAAPTRDLQNNKEC